VRYLSAHQTPHLHTRSADDKRIAIFPHEGGSWNITDLCTSKSPASEVLESILVPPKPPFLDCMTQFAADEPVWAVEKEAKPGPAIVEDCTITGRSSSLKDDSAVPRPIAKPDGMRTEISWPACWLVVGLVSEQLMPHDCLSSQLRLPQSTPEQSAEEQFASMEDILSPTRPLQQHEIWLQFIAGGSAGGCCESESTVLLSILVGSGSFAVDIPTPKSIYCILSVADDPPAESSKVAASPKVC